MSELRDLAAALKSMSDSLTSIESCMAEQVVNGVQLREGMHDLRNKLQGVLLEKGRTERAVEQIETWIGDFGRKLHETTTNVANVRNRVELLADQVTAGFRDDRREIRDLKGLPPTDEVTRT